MSPNRRMIVLVLIGLGGFQIVAAGIALVFWAVTGEWQRYMPTIVSLGLLAWPVAYLVWRRYVERLR